MMVGTGIYAVISLHSYVFKPYSGVSTLILFFDKKYKDKSILYLKSIENDGFERGEGRLPINDNDLPDCEKDIEIFRKYLNGEIARNVCESKITGKIIDSSSYDENYDFHPYSYYMSDPQPRKKYQIYFM